ncbi:GMP synthase [glutamine-hydrolyzing] [Weissella viridescens]|uniref:GMP synthase [glutamine-hydrolyzing] n=1 Tax=Weissella viridescens TaxID=1629 RepID=A0A380NYK4_WEIVI|nr:GMP synthase [glutamine-hydrolyzing] [Weissella viridescens]
MANEQQHDTILVLDFGSQYNQLISRRIRELGVYSELKPHTLTAEQIKEINPKGLFSLVDRTQFTLKMPSPSTLRF